MKRCNLQGPHFGRVCDALPRNSHLRTLDVSINPLHKDDLRRHLLPAVRANTGLRTLVSCASHDWTYDADRPVLQELNRIIAARSS